MLLTISMRICSLSSSVHDEHSRNTMLNSSHCSSSHEFDEVSNTLRTVALTADTITASRISQASRLPVQRVNASMARLKVKSDCNVHPPDGASAVLTAQARTAACPGRARSRRTIPARRVAVNWKFVDIKGEYRRGPRSPV